MLEPNKPNFDFSPRTPPTAARGEVPSSSAFQANANSNTAYNPSQFDPNTSQMSSQQQFQPPPQEQQQQQQGESDEAIYKGVHPFAAFFHIAFKIAALLTFILGGIFSSSHVVIFVITILFLAADFWTTKNVTGRLLVSLRWWNEVREDGSSHWIFESAPDADKRVNKFDKWFFWVTTGGNCAAWVLMVLFNMMSFTRLPMAVVGVILGGANFVGFLKCSRDASQRLRNYVITQAAQRPDLVRQVAGAL
ncbi:protein FAM18B1 [Trypanosoma theileri]|uniref:Golgi apparatus membrane protein TVP23 homolog n=1 Tax=Trypanosoma theileri TaxID=67003 RepID=A0A1X0NSV4_9TRYP|nr:protein FAM18B1 [Trypanosoma theileri]ORC87190.1 protein FAM18B1 [Trypanosoma theileri]